MKKVLSVLLAMVLFVSAMSMGNIGLTASAACAKHVYTNACDTKCNACGATRQIENHTYEDCFVDCENNIKSFCSVSKSAPKTAVFGIELVNSTNFSAHNITVTDESNMEVIYNEQLKGWPLVEGNNYLITVKCENDEVDVNDVDFNLIEVTDKIFPDTKPDKWYSDAVMYALGAGILKGYSNGNFGLSDNIQRQDFIVMLARFDGVDLTEYDYASTLRDVKDNYYRSAVNWGYENGIITGYQNGKFGVGDPITREQIITFLYRYATYKGLDCSVSSDDINAILEKYSDVKKVSPFAYDAVMWGIKNSVIEGVKVNDDSSKMKINPQNNAQRCEVAQIMYNNFATGVVTGKEYCFHDSDYDEATCTQPKKCHQCGKTLGIALGHSFYAISCTEAKVCSGCDATGEVIGHNYVAGECINKINGQVCGDYDANYCPKLYFTGDMSQITNPKQTNKKIECEIDFEYRSKDQVVSGAAKIKLQGNSSLKYAKKNYTVNFYKDPSFDSKQKIDVGWGKQSKYCLKANWIDKTHSRNIISARIASQAQAKYGLFSTAPNNGTIDGFPVEIYINGEFHGLYTMNIPKDEWMFAMDKNDPNHIVICGENWNDPVLFKTVPTDLNDWTVEAGPEDEATLEKVQRLVDFVLNSSDEEFKQNFGDYLNLDSTLNYFVLMSYFWASDNTGKNMLLATYDGEVWYPTLYDLDTTWGTHWEGNKLYDYSKGFVNGSNSILWKRFQENFSKELADRYFELRQDVLNPTNVMAEFNAHYNTIPNEVLAREKAKWNTVETPIPGYDFTQIQDYLDTVVPRLDQIYNRWR